MGPLTNMGFMGINEELKGSCQHCLWLEWNPRLNNCANAGTCFCPRGSAGEKGRGGAAAGLVSNEHVNSKDLSPFP